MVQHDCPAVWLGAFHVTVCVHGVEWSFGCRSVATLQLWSLGKCQLELQVVATVFQIADAIGNSTTFAQQYP